MVIGSKKHHIRLLAASGLIAASFYAPQALAGSEVSNTVTKSPTSLTLYQSGRGIFRSQHDVTLKSGAHRYEISGFPVSLIPDTVSLSPDSKDKTRILSIAQSSLPVSGGNLLNRYLGKSIGWRRVNPVTGKVTIEDAVLVDNSNGILLKFGDRYELFPDGSPVFGEDALRFVGKRVLQFDALSETQGPEQITATYLADGFSWNTGYSLHLSRDGAKAHLKGAAVIRNDTQSTIEPSRITLVAGDIRHESPVQPQRAKMAMMRTEAVALSDSAAGNAPEIQSVQDRQVIMLPGLSDLPAHTSRKITFLDWQDIPVERLYKTHARVGGYEGRNAPKRDLPVAIEILMKGEALTSVAGDDARGLARGLVRVYDAEAEVPLLLGESRMADRAAGEDVRLNIGSAFDLVTTRKQTHFNRLDDKGRFESDYRVSFENRGKKPVTLIHQEHMFGDWKILQSSQDFKVMDARRAEWRLVLAPGQSVDMTYSVTVTP